MGERGLALLAGALLLAAYAPLLWSESASVSTGDAEQWFFAPEDTSPALVCGIALWLVWRRRGALAARSLRPGKRLGLPLCSIALGLLVFVWAQRTGAHDLLAASLAAHLAGFAALAKGSRGLRAVALPCAVLLLAIPIPSPLYNELVWQLQLFGARAAQGLLELVGIALRGEGVVLQRGEQSFLVIEECSGLRGIRTQLMVAIVVGELLWLGPRARLALLLLAPPLALLLNALRIAVIAATSDPSALSAEGTHLGQGLLLLLAGAALLFACGHALGGRRGPPAPPPHNGRPPWRPICGLLALQALIAWTLPAWPVPDPPRPPLAAIPDTLGPWSASPSKPDRLFFGQLPLGQILHRRYARSRQGQTLAEVDLLIAVDAARLPRLRPYAPKLFLPGRDWVLTAKHRDRIWSLFQDIEVAYARRGQERALVYLWTLRDAGLPCETLRSLLGLERGPFARPARRVVVRLSTPLMEGERAHHHAQRTLDRFIGDFREVLSRL